MSLWEMTKLEDEDDELGEDLVSLTGKDGLIMLMDCTQSMFLPTNPNEEERSFDLSMKCANSVMKNKIVAGNKDLVGIVFFGTEKTKNSTEFKNIYIFHDLAQPGASSVLQVESMIETSSEKFRREYGHCDSFSLSDALWTCSTMFSNCEQKLGHKRLLLFTCNDNPHESNLTLQNQARKRASDLHNIGIDIHLMHIQRSDDQFDVTKFYRDILPHTEDDESNLPDASKKFEELMTRVRRKDNKKRAVSNIMFNLSDDIGFSVGVFNLVRIQIKPTAVRLYKNTNELIKTTRKVYNPENGEVLFPSDIKFSQTYCNKTISFEKDELNEIKSIGNLGITLLGFKPKSYLKLYHYIRPASFIYPNESIVKGSTKIFAALLKKCIDKEVIAICWFKQRQNLKPFLVALLPQEETFDDKNVQIEPPGFHVIYLPFRENIRALEIENENSDFYGRPNANEEQINKAKEMIKKLQFNFNSEAFDNPALQTHFRNIEALALNEENVDDIIDYTAPNNEVIHKRAGSVIEEFKDIVFPEDYNPDYKPSKIKKPETGAAKAVIEVDMKEEAKAGRLTKWTVPVLKKFAREAKLKCGGKKAEIIEAILKHFDLD